MSTADMLAVTRQTARAHRAEIAIEESQHATSLAQFRKSSGEEVVAAVKRWFPELSPFPMVGDPSGSSVALHMVSPQEKGVASALSWACDNSHFSGLATALSKHWGLLHRTIMEGDCKPCPGAAAPNKCLHAGVCLCNEKGQRLEQKVKRFLNHAKMVCPLETSGRGALVGGRLVVRLLGRPSEYEAMFAESGPGIQDIWYHIGLMYKSPFEPVFMEVCPVPDLAEAPPDRRRIYVKSLHKFSCLYQAFEPFSESDVISARWYRLEEADRPIAAFSPETVLVIEMAGFSESKQFWPRRTHSTSRVAGVGPATPGVIVGGEFGPEQVESDPEQGRDNGQAEEGSDLEFEGLLYPLLDAYEAELDIAELVEQPEGAAATTTAAPHAAPAAAPARPPQTRQNAASMASCRKAQQTAEGWRSERSALWRHDHFLRQQRELRGAPPPPPKLRAHHGHKTVNQRWLIFGFVMNLPVPLFIHSVPKQMGGGLPMPELREHPSSSSMIAPPGSPCRLVHGRSVVCQLIRGAAQRTAP